MAKGMDSCQVPLWHGLRRLFYGEQLKPALRLHGTQCDKPIKDPSDATGEPHNNRHCSSDATWPLVESEGHNMATPLSAAADQAHAKNISGKPSHISSGDLFSI